jgi:ribosomal protein L37E
MTLCYTCAVCGYTETHSFRQVAFGRLGDADYRVADVPLQSKDQGTVLVCANCGGDSTYDEGATCKLSGVPARLRSELEVQCDEYRRVNAKEPVVVDMNSRFGSTSNRRGGQTGVQLGMLDGTGKAAGWSKREV